MKTRLDNDMIDYTTTVYTENKIKLSWPIGVGEIYDKNKIGQWHNRLYVWSTMKPKLNCWDLYDWVRSMMRIKQDNDMSDPTSVVYAENKTNLSWSIEPYTVRDKNQIE